MFEHFSQPGPLRICLAAVVVAFCSYGCSVRVVYGEDPAFDACRSACDGRELDVSLTCTLFRSESRDQYFEAVLRSHEAGDYLLTKIEGCGCGTARVTEDGRLTDYDFIFVQPPEAAAAYTELLDEVKLRVPVSECLFDEPVHIAFGDNTSEWLAANGRRHTVYPVYQFIKHNELSETPDVQLASEMGWSSLNINFGILYLGEDRYLAEATRYCMPTTDPESIQFDEPVNAKDVVPADTLRIDDCYIAYLYPIDTEQELALKRLSLAPALGEVQ